MNRIFALHGSTALPKKPEQFKFEHFNYVRVNEKVIDNEFVNNGHDAGGPGIYAQLVDESGITQEQLTFADSYAGLQGEGSIMGFSIDMEDEDGEPIRFANEEVPHAVSAEEWAGVVMAVADEIRRLASYHKEDALSSMWEIAGIWETTGEPPSRTEIESIISDAPTLDFDEIMPDEMEPDDWVNNLQEQLDVCDPASHILEECGYEFESVARYAENIMERSDSLWDVLTTIYGHCAVIESGMGQKSFNKAFHFAAINNISQHELLRAAMVDGGQTLVLFDVYAGDINYIRQMQFNMPSGAIDNIKKTVNNVKAEYGDTLTFEQIGMKIQDGIKSEFGLLIKDRTAKLMAISKPGSEFADHIMSAIKEDVGELINLEWATNENARNMFTVKSSAPEHGVETPKSPKI